MGEIRSGDDGSIRVTPLTVEERCEMIADELRSIERARRDAVASLDAREVRLIDERAGLCARYAVGDEIDYRYTVVTQQGPIEVVRLCVVTSLVPVAEESPCGYEPGYIVDMGPVGSPHARVALSGFHLTSEDAESLTSLRRPHRASEEVS